MITFLCTQAEALGELLTSDLTLLPFLKAASNIQKAAFLFFLLFFFIPLWGVRAFVLLAYNAAVADV